jgi:dTDP-glucose 4,6-dehydratase
MNVMGERQHPEKFIPMTIKKVINGETVLIHSSGDKKTSGSRCWIHARNVLSALFFLTERGQVGEKYNIVGEERSNLAIAEDIAKYLGKELKYEMIDFHSSRPGHDLRYALDGSKLKAMGFSYDKTLEQSLQKTVNWTIKRPRWLN